MPLTRTKPHTELRQRNLAIYKDYLAGPDTTMSEIAREYGFSAQRVRFLISRQFRDDCLRPESLVEKYLIKEICP
jgi:hypothetical protein